MMETVFKYLLLFTIIQCFICLCTCDNVKKSVNDNRDDNGDTNDESKDELEIPAEPEPRPTPTNLSSCFARRQGSTVHEIRRVTLKQFPFVAAVLSQQNEYVCSGTVVANGIILTTAHCIDLSIGYVLLNAVSDKKDNNTIEMHITKVEKFPTSSKNVGLIYTKNFNASVVNKLDISNYTNTKNLVEFEAIGFGLNANLGQTKELQHVGLEYRATVEHKSELILGYIDCIDTKISTCFKDTGGPALLNNELIGIVVEGQNVCTNDISSEFAANKLMATVLPVFTFKGWLEERIKKHKTHVKLSSYPAKPARRSFSERKALKSSSKSYYINNEYCLIYPLMYSTIFKFVE